MIRECTYFSKDVSSGMTFCAHQDSQRTNSASAVTSGSWICPWIYSWICPWIYSWICPWIYSWIRRWVYLLLFLHDLHQM